MSESDNVYGNNMVIIKASSHNIFGGEYCGLEDISPSNFVSPRFYVR